MGMEGDEGEDVRVSGMMEDIQSAVMTPPMKIYGKRRRSENVDVSNDDDYAFFHSMAAVCQKFSPRTKSTVKFKIHQIIHEAELETLPLENSTTVMPHKLEQVSSEFGFS